MSGYYKKKLEKYNDKNTLLLKNIGVLFGGNPSWKLRSNPTIDYDNPYEGDKYLSISTKNTYSALPIGNRLYPGEAVNVNSTICINENVPVKNPANIRFTLSNVHNFVKQCPDVSNEFMTIRHSMDFFKKTNTDFLLLTEMVPLTNNITDPINTGNFNKLIDELKAINLKNKFISLTHYIKASLPYFYFLANGIFGSSKLINTRTFEIGSNRILMECIIQIYDKLVLLYVVHVHENYINDMNDNIKMYDENLSNIISIIKESSNKYQISHIIMGGDLNFPVGEYDVYSTLDSAIRQAIVMSNPRDSIVNPIEKSNLLNFLHYVAPDNSAECTLTGFNKKAIIDMFFVSNDILKNFNVKSHIVPSDFSDHYPVILDISAK